MKTKQFILTLLLSFAFFSCDDDSSLIVEAIEQPVDEEIDPPEDGIVIVLPAAVASCVGHDNTQQYDANRSFAFDIFNALNEVEPESNIFVSPFSISVALQMLYNGTNGVGQTEMEEALNLTGLELDEINQNYFCLIDELENLDEGVILNIANSIWSHDEFFAKEEFLNRNQDFLSSSFFNEDFDNPATVDKINDWVADKTEDKILNVLDEIPNEAVMYLINAIYFNGTWKYAFDPEASFEGNFFGLDAGELTETTFMRQKSDFNYVRTEDYQAIDLPYGEDKFALSVFLPSGKINEFIEDFTVEEYRAAIAQYEMTEVLVELPKFVLEYKTSLNDALMSLGMNGIFSPGSLENIQEEHKLVVSRVIHQTFLDVNEEGTEAAAVTVIEVGTTSVGPDGPETMRMNRPFFFLIRDTVNDNILFTGKVVNPES